MKRTAISLFITITSFCAYAQSESGNTENTATESEHTAKTTTLKELVVTGENAWFEGNKAVFVPRKNEKKLATDAVSLIDNMGTPLLYVKDNQIMSRMGGKPVSIFINGEPASETDLKTFWPQNAVRVEYMQNPDNPKFLGSTNVVNFIMKDYSLGGLTKTQVYQRIPNGGSYDIASKFVYRKMTYSATVGGGYEREHMTGSYENQTYEDVWYGRQHYDRIDRTEHSNNNAIRNDNIKAALNARYNNNRNFVATHNASFIWNRNPESCRNGSASYTPRLFDGTEMQVLTKGRNSAADVAGNYFFLINNKFTLGMNWCYAHSHNNNFSSYSEGDAPEITNKSRENVNSGFLSMRFFWRLHQKMNLQGGIGEKRSWFSTIYSGSALNGTGDQTDQWQHRGQTDLYLQWHYQINPETYLLLRPQLSIADWNINHKVKDTQWMPGADLTFNYNINPRNNFNFSLYFSQEPPSASSSNDLMLRESELVWIAGNPHIKSIVSYCVAANYSWIPLNWLNMNIAADWHLYDNWEYFTYTPGGEDLDGVIKRYSNTANYGSLHFKYDLNVKLFKNHLRLMAGIEFDHQYFTGIHSSYNFIRPEIRANAYFGNCNAGITYYFKSKRIQDGGTTMLHKPESFYVFFGYGTGNFNLHVSLSNPFVKHSVYRYIITRVRDKKSPQKVESTA